MRIRIIHCHSGFLTLEKHWNRLPRQSPFLSWSWLESWWRHLGSKDPSSRLLIAVVQNHAGDIMGIAPWYRRSSFRQGTQIRFLGDGAACSEYMGILAEPGMEVEIGRTLAAWLDSDGSSQWDSLQLEGADCQNAAFSAFTESLRTRGYFFLSSPGTGCWVLSLPSRWDDYLARRSQKHRSALRSLDCKYFATGKAQLHWANTPKEVAEGVDHLITLHLKRKKSLGASTTFERPELLEFLRETSTRFSTDGRLWLHWLTLDGKPVAALYDIKEAGRVYGYAMGIDPDALPRSPGKLIFIGTFKKAINEGVTHYDFLTGDESYKSHWRATLIHNSNFTVIGKRASSRFRGHSRLLFRRIKSQAAELVAKSKIEPDCADATRWRWNWPFFRSDFVNRDLPKTAVEAIVDGTSTSGCTQIVKSDEAKQDSSRPQ